MSFMTENYIMGNGDSSNGNKSKNVRTMFMYNFICLNKIYTKFPAVLVDSTLLHCTVNLYTALYILALHCTLLYCTVHTSALTDGQKN